MNRHPYPAYKPSGLEWPDEVPANWDVSRLSFLFTRSNAGEVIDKGHWGEGGELLFTCAREPLSSDYSDFPTEKRTTVRDLLLTRNGTPYVHTPPGNAIYSNVVQRITLKLGFDRGYLSYSLGSACQGLKGYGVSIESLNFEMWKSLSITFPTEQEQHTIATHLDRETTRIDALIEKKQKQIELLQEKRTALISHAVTKGLNPNVNMKDSGVEWLGEIPWQWKVKRLRYLGYCQNGINIGAEYFGAGYPFVSYGDVFNNRELPDSVDGLVLSSVSDRERYSVRAGDVFFTRTSETIEDIGFSSVCLESIHDAVFAGFLIRFRPRGRDLATVFSKFYFQNIFLRAFFVKEMNLVTRASLSQDLLKLMPVLIPPLEEQAQIASFLDRETAHIDALTEKVEKSIALLREYRTSLISAAVTGKIDVRKETTG